MPAIDKTLIARDQSLHQLAKRNWADNNVGVIVVFCIVFIVAVGLITLFTYRKMMAKKALRQG